VTRATGIGPELLSAASDNDPTNIGTATAVGAQTGYQLAWLALLVGRYGQVVVVLRYLMLRLLAAGAVPVAFVLGTCVYHIAHQGAMQSLRQSGQNQEMMQFTQGVYEARELALARMQAEAEAAQSSGIVGVTVEVKNHVWGEHATEFLATGTAVRRLADEHRLPDTSPKPSFTLGLDS
jgi:uncharacterized protein YbjQ (UPF0145 family)